MCAVQGKILAGRRRAHEGDQPGSATRLGRAMARESLMHSSRTPQLERRMPDANREQDRTPSYLDENLSESEKQGQTRVPAPEQEGAGEGKATGKTMNPQRPDEFGDGDRRS